MEPTIYTTMAQVLRIFILFPRTRHPSNAGHPSRSLTHPYPDSNPKISAFARALVALSEVALSEGIDAEIADAMQGEYRCLRQVVDRYEVGRQKTTKVESAGCAL
jgi:hypothetical protein